VIDIGISETASTLTLRERERHHEDRFGLESSAGSEEVLSGEDTKRTRLLSSRDDPARCDSFGVLFSDKLGKFQFPDIPEARLVERGDFHGTESRIERVNKVRTRVNCVRVIPWSLITRLSMGEGSMVTRAEAISSFDVRQ